MKKHIPRATAVFIIACLAISGLFLSGCRTAPSRPDTKRFEPRLCVKQGQAWKGVYTKREIGRSVDSFITMENISTVEAFFDITVTQVAPDGTPTFEIVLTRVTSKKQGTSGSQSYDSAQPKPGEEYLRAFNGHRFKVVLSAEGRIIKISGFAGVFDRIVSASGVPDADVPTRERRLAETLKNQFNDRSIAELMIPLFDFYPPAPVTVGESWQKQHQLNAFIPNLSQKTLTLRERQNGLARIELQSDISPNPDMDQAELKDLRYRFRMWGTETGTIVVNEADGMIRQGDYHTEADVKMTLLKNEPAGPGAPDDDIEVPFIVVLDIRIQLD